jgi:hypothetical protein
MPGIFKQGRDEHPEPRVMQLTSSRNMNLETFQSPTEQAPEIHVEE